MCFYNAEGMLLKDGHNIKLNKSSDLANVDNIDLDSYIMTVQMWCEWFMTPMGRIWFISYFYIRLRITSSSKFPCTFRKTECIPTLHPLGNLKSESGIALLICEATHLKIVGETGASWLGFLIFKLLPHLGGCAE